MLASKEGLFEVSGSKVSGRLFNASFNTDALEVRELSSGCAFVSWSAAAATDATVKLQAAMTVSGPWEDISGATKTIGAATGTGRLALSDVGFPYLRAVGTVGSETAALVTIRYYFKGAR